MTTDTIVKKKLHPLDVFGSSEEGVRAEGRIVLYSIVNCMLAAFFGYAIGLRKGVIDFNVAWIGILVLMLITAYAMSVPRFIRKDGMGGTIKVLLWGMWAFAALIGVLTFMGFK